MGIIRTETFDSQDGVKMRRDIYLDAYHKEVSVEYMENPPITELAETPLNATEQQEARETYIMAML